jgi:arabinofuranosyltransferase
MGQTEGKGWSLAAPAFVSLAFSLVFIARTTFTVNGERYFTLFDDAMISMRYARNLADGHGLTWNPGQAPVEGYTNFLWTLWMALLHLPGVSESKISLLVLLSGAVILIANLSIVRLVSAQLAPGSPLAASLAVWLTALYYPLIYWTLRGMEVGLVTLTISAAVLLALRLRDRFRPMDLIALAVLMALGILTRPDVIIPCVLISGFVFLTARPEHRRDAGLVLGAAVAGTFAVHTGFRLYYYGAALPNTYYLKVSGATLDARVARGLRGLLGFGVLHLLVPLVLSTAGLIAGYRAARAHPGGYLLAAIFLALCGYSVYVGGDAWDTMLYANRYITPAMSGLLILTALGIADLMREQAGARRGAARGLAALFVVVAALTVIAPAATQGLSATKGDERWRIARSAVTLAPILVLPLVRLRKARVVVVTIASLVAINGFALSLWLEHNAFYADDDEWATRYGLALRAATADDASIAVTWAGAIPYFSHRPVIDLLGKSDRHIAMSARQPSAGFEPGHDKWDYAYSIGQLRPDVVADLWQASEDDLTSIERWGYVPLAPWVFARADSTRVDQAAVKRAACTILREDPFILGSTTRSAPDSRDLAARYCPE